MTIQGSYCGQKDLLVSKAQTKCQELGRSKTAVPTDLPLERPTWPSTLPSPELPSDDSPVIRPQGPEHQVISASRAT